MSTPSSTLHDRVRAPKLSIRGWVSRPAHFSIGSRLAVAAAALACVLVAGPTHAADEVKPSPPAPERDQLTIALEDAAKPWTGDLDGMIERRVIRILTVYSKNFYFRRRETHRKGQR